MEKNHMPLNTKKKYFYDEYLTVTMSFSLNISELADGGKRKLFILKITLCSQYVMPLK